MQKHVNLVDLVKSFPTNIYLQNLASIQKRTSPVKFAHLAEKSGKGSISNLSTKGRGIDSWLREYGYESVAAADLDLIVGIEFYNPQTRGSETIPLQFEQYGFMATRRSPILRLVLEDVVRNLVRNIKPSLLHVAPQHFQRNVEKKSWGDSGGNGTRTELLSFDGQLNSTEDNMIEASFGPVMWTKALLGAISKYSTRSGADSEGRQTFILTGEKGIYVSIIRSPI